MPLIEVPRATRFRTSGTAMRFHLFGSRASGRSAILLSTARRRLLAFAGMPTVEPAGTALFLRRWWRRPFAMGAVVPSGRLLAEAMARTTLSVMAGRDGHVIELGAGTGEVTKALLAVGIAAERLALVERDQELAAFLRRHF